MGYISSKRHKGKVHYISCRFAGRIPNKNRIRYQNFQEIKLAGREFCKCCSYIYQTMRREQKWFDDFCEENGLAYCFRSNDNTLEI